MVHKREYYIYGVPPVMSSSVGRVFSALFTAAAVIDRKEVEKVKRYKRGQRWDELVRRWLSLYKGVYYTLWICPPVIQV